MHSARWIFVLKLLVLTMLANATNSQAASTELLQFVPVKKLQKMQILRVEAIPHETLYVFADNSVKHLDLSNDPACFSPIGYTIEEVEPGDIPAAAKIVAIESPGGPAKRVALETAMQMLGNARPVIRDEIAAAISNLREVMVRNGLHPPVKILLETQRDVEVAAGPGSAPQSRTVVCGIEISADEPG
jgi:hypothetical protein